MPDFRGCGAHAGRRSFRTPAGPLLAHRCRRAGRMVMIQKVTVALIAAMFVSVVGCGDPGPLGDTTWVLESLNGQPAVEGIHPTLRVNRKSYGGQDGCNAFSGRSLNGGQIATVEGTFSAPPAMGTLRGCDSAEVADQADAYTDALLEGERFVVEDDRLEIMDGSGETLLVFSRQRPLPPVIRTTYPERSGAYWMREPPLIGSPPWPSSTIVSSPSERHVGDMSLNTGCPVQVFAFPACR